jgi:benzoyl-CoA reductase subunit B
MGKYKTEPIRCWQKAKELRASVYERIARARDEGRIIVSGGTESMLALPAGYDMEFLGGEPYGASCAFAGKHDPSVCLGFFEAAEAARYPRDLCAYMRLTVGSLLANRYLFGGAYPKPTFNLQTHICDTHGKWYQIMSDIEGVPYHAVDFIPYAWETENETEESKRLKREYLVGQMLDTIDWMEKVTGENFDDEKFISAVNWECESTNLWARCCMANRAIPAVMDEKMMFSFYVIAVLMRQRKEAVDFYTELLDELEDRKRRGIAACADERFRFIHDSQPPWFSLDIFRYLEDFGAISIGAHYSFSLSGGWAYDPAQDTWLPAKPPREAGVELRTREEACEWYAEWILAYHTLLRSLRWSGRGKHKRILDIVKNWRADGVVIHLNRGCEGTAVGQMELNRFLSDENIPCMTYEGNLADSREFDYERTMAKIDTFMETLGLKKLS